MTRKNWGLLIILLILTGVLGMLAGRKGPAGSMEVDEDIFAMEDTAAVQRIELLQQQGGETRVLERQGGGWVLNNTYKADDQIMRLLLSVLHNVEVRRPVGRTQQEEVSRLLQQEGTQVRVYGAGGLQKDFYAGGREQGQLSYFMQDGQAYVVELPGYASYVSGIFSLSTNNLRDRTVFRTNFMTFKQLSVRYPDEREDVVIRFDGNNLEVEGVAQPDSAQLLGFLGLFENLQATGYVNAQEFPDLDSLLQQEPVAGIRVANLSEPEGKVLQLFSATPDKRYRLGWLPAEQQALLLDERLARLLLVEKEQLMKKEEE